MPRRRKYGKRGRFKLKLKKGTIYSVFAAGLILLGAILFLTFSRNGESFILINDLLNDYFGNLSILLPLLFVLSGFMFLRLRFFVSKPNVAVGFLIFFLSVASIAKSGVIGSYLFETVAQVLTGLGATITFLAGIFIGLVVFFDTSIDELIKGIAVLKKNTARFIPRSFVGFFKKRRSEFGERPMTIKGDIKYPSVSNKGPVVVANTVKKDESLILEKLVSNTLSSGLIWEYPPLSLLDDTESRKADRGDVKKIASIIEKTLESFGIAAKVVEVNLGPAVTQYALEIALGTKVSKITSLQNDLALATEAPTGQIRIEAPIPGRNLIGIEIPNRSLEIVSLRTMLESDVMRRSKSKLTVSMGLDVSGNPIVSDISKMPHVLIAGTTGSGKSVMINSLISSILFRASPEEVKLILIDPKRVELTGYNGIPHLMVPVIVEVEKILSALKWALNEMDRRYKTFAERGVRNIDSYNELAGFQALPFIIIFIDELADLMAFAPVEVEDSIARLAQMARATGIHLIVSTQRPSVDVITGLIKANIPARIAFNVSSMIDSRVIIDGPGAEKLLGRGDMLYVPPDQAKPTRIQGAFVSDKEVRKLVEYLRSKAGAIQYTEEIISQPIVSSKTQIGAHGPDGRDPMFIDAIRIVCEYDRASASLLQRRLSVGYSRAARIVDQLEAAGIVGHAEGSKPRDVLVRNPDDVINNLQA